VRSTPNPAGAAEAAEKAAAARAEAEERAAAVDAAQETLATARVAYDDAKREFASATAERDAAQARADQIHRMAEDAAKDASRSQRVLGALVRSLAQQGSGGAAAGVLLDSHGGANILYQLGTLDKLSELSGNVEVVRDRAEADKVRAESLAAQDAAAQQVVLSIPVDQAKAAVDAAKAQFDAASAALASLRTSAPVGLVGLTPLAELLVADTGQLSDQGWAHPAIGRITDVFGPRPEKPVPGVGEFHHGTDIGAACNAGIYAATSGVVVAAGSLGTYGNWVLIDHGDGIETGYAHLADGETLVTIGEPVIAGQVIGGVGSTGASTGCHLHFEVRIDGTRVDAQSFMAERGIELGAE
jgi:murein DD-endopeptidase MepM/ murein hydrolase activator NlpD